MREIIVALAAAFGVGLIVVMVVLALLAGIRLMERKRKPPLDDNQLAVYGDGAWPRTIGPEPADQVPDDDDRAPPLPKSKRPWPGLRVR